MGHRRSHDRNTPDHSARRFRFNTSIGPPSFPVGSDLVSRRIDTSGRRGVLRRRTDLCSAVEDIRHCFPTGCLHEADRSARLRKTPVTSVHMNSPDGSLGKMIGREAGTALAGDSPLTVRAAQVRTLGDQVPAGAKIDSCLNQITFTTPIASFVIEAVPPNNPDMTFRIAGLVNPTVVVPLNTQVRIEYINADSDEAHTFVITSANQPLTFRPAGPPAFAGAAAGAIGDPTAAGHGARDVAFTAGTTGTFRYLCPMPGHAEMGMYGNFVVQ